MSIICKLFGHTPSSTPGIGADYGDVYGGYEDGIRREHFQLRCRCARCGHRFFVGSFHGPIGRGLVEAETKAAVDTVKLLGYTYCGGEFWKPPVEGAPRITGPLSGYRRKDCEDAWAWLKTIVDSRAPGCGHARVALEELTALARHVYPQKPGGGGA